MVIHYLSFSSSTFFNRAPFSIEDYTSAVVKEKEKRTGYCWQHLVTAIFSREARVLRPLYLRVVVPHQTNQTPFQNELIQSADTTR